MDDLSHWTVATCSPRAAGEMKYCQYLRNILNRIFFTRFKVNYWYLNIYVLWMNTILNIVLPIILLVVLNILVSTVSAVSAEKKLFASMSITSKIVRVLVEDISTLIALI